jgi:hypothetical protein
MAAIGEVRRNQLITTYGIGAMIAIEDASYMVMGLDRWNVNGPNLHEPRLEKRLGVQGFVLPPASKNGPDIPVVRFPEMYSCPTCRRLDKHSFFCENDNNQCNSCSSPLVPSRFVVCCPKGHINDFPYFNWVHAGAARVQADHVLKIEPKGASASLRDISINCSCGATRTMEGAFGKKAMQGIARCSGRRPWLPGDAELCSELPRTLQRGASNVWFPVVHSSISIPPWSEGAFTVLSKYWVVLRHVPDDSLYSTIQGLGVSAGTPYTVEDLVNIVRQRRLGSELPDNAEALRIQEYEALTRGQPERTRRDEFVCVPATGLGSTTSQWFGCVMQVKRLREVRALHSFTRLYPSTEGDPAATQAPIFAANPLWLPAIEVTGEGVFLKLRTDRLREWEAKPEVIARAKRIDDNSKRRLQVLGGNLGRTISPRFLLVHTLAHALINQWALECGYPAASLRERIYVSDSMAGLLIYTATSDSAGSLGGVVAQAKSDRLDNSLLDAMTQASWCSGDPLCIEADAQGVDSLNLAACHACVLLPEVSCEEMNLFLDRAMLVGTLEDPSMGYFRSAIEMD